jgi:hypothetical protein
VKRPTGNLALKRAVDHNVRFVEAEVLVLAQTAAGRVHGLGYRVPLAGLLTRYQDTNLRLANREILCRPFVHQTPLGA